MNKVMEAITEIPAWLAGTTIEQTLLKERAQLDEKAAAAAIELRQQSETALTQAILAERTDSEIASLRDREALTQKRIKDAEATVANGPLELAAIQRSINSRIRFHRESQDAIRAQMDTPDWQRKAIDVEIAKLIALRASVAALSAKPLEEKIGQLINGMEKVTAVLDYREVRGKLLGVAARPLDGVAPVPGWIGTALSALKKLRREILTQAELDSRIAAIWKSQPAVQASWRKLA